MKIKIIDLLVKIANGEEVPKKIKYRDRIWEYTTTVIGKGYQYYNDFYQEWITLQNQVYLEEVLNDEVEIIEEPKKIEKIKSNGDEFYSDYIGTWISKNNTDAYCEFLMNKINEIIEEIKILKENK